MIAAMRRRLLLLTTVLLAFTSAASADEKYASAPGAIHEVQSAPGLPVIQLSPDGQWALILRPVRNPPIAELAAPMLRLAGVRVNPRSNGLHNPGYARGGLLLRHIADGKEVVIKGTAELKLRSPVWNPQST